MPVGKAEIIFYPRRRSRLSTEGSAVDGQDRKAFGRGIDRRCEAGRARPDHHDIVKLLGIDRADQPDAAGELVLGRIPKELPARTEHDRKLFRRYLEALNEGLGAGISGRVEPLVGMAVPAEEIDEAKHVGVGLVADDDGAGTRFDQSNPAQDQRTHDALAKLRLGDQQCAKPVGGDGNALDVGQRGRID